MSITCDGQGQIPVMDIVNAVNSNTEEIGLSNAAIDALDVRVGLNEVELSDHLARIIALESDSVSSGDIVALEARVTQNEADISANTGDISTNSGNINTNTNDIAGLTGRVTTNEGDIAQHTIEIDSLNTGQNALGARVSTNEVDIAQNASDIASLQAAIGAGNEAIFGHSEATAIDGGTSTTGTWTPRNIETQVLNDIGAIGGATSVTLDIGTYDLEVHAIVVGSASQTRINIGGTQFIYGFSLNSEGLSQAIGRVTLTSPTVISIETNVDVGVANSGFGLSNTFGTNNTYVTFHIEKVG